jgi:hypothetical protein
MPGQVVVQYQLQSSEVSRALRWRALHNSRVYLSIGIGLLLLLGGALLVHANDRADTNPAPGQIMIGIGVFEIVLFVLIIVVNPTRAFRVNPALRNLQYFAFSDDGIHTRSAVSEARSQWQVYSQTYEHNDCYLLRLSVRAAYQIVPRRAFSTPADEALFRSLLERHTVAHLRPTDPAASPGQHTGW